MVQTIIEPSSRPHFIPAPALIQRDGRSPEGLT